ncbi:MAG TPA: selenocysteine-specific translation elongation factor [Burkholderiales bacterium]
MIVATAGHVDHGKTSLVRALTGVDTDRLPEEKRRGMTIDLGFAYSGALGFVDVPGHERFVHNMLAGVGGVDLALLVVAADDGVMPQTREHLAIVDLLGVPRGALAITKIDRVGAERVRQVESEARALLSATRLAGAAAFRVSPVTGEGVAELRAHLESLARQVGERKARGNFRLAVDRCFTLPGAGLIVTGTALSGEVKVGDEVRALLAGARARVRSIHAQNAPAGRGAAGQRLALNLAGLDGKARIARGDWIAAGNVPDAVARFDARLKWISETKLRDNLPVHVHLGAADVLGRIAPLDGQGLAQLVLAQPVGALRGDRFIVRGQSSRRTLGGGTVIDVFPPPRGRARPERLAWLRAMEIEDDETSLSALLELAAGGVDMARFSANRNLAPASGVRFSTAHWQRLREQALSALAAWHRDSPERGGLPADRLLPGGRVGREVLDRLVAELVAEGLAVRDAAGLRLRGHEAKVSPADEALWKRVRPLLEKAALRPPSLAELSASLKEDPKRLEAALARLERHGLVVRVAKNRFFLPGAVGELKRIAAELARQQGRIVAAAYRDRSGIGRNVAIEVLEYFDRIKFTRRAGDAHVLVTNSGSGS